MSIQYRTGVTFVVVTHDQEEAMALSSRIAVMDKGQVVQVGTPQDIYEYPNCRFAADFIGSINLFDGTVKSVTKDKAVVTCADWQGDINVDRDATLEVGQNVSVAVRPEKISISKKAPAKALNAIEGRVIDLGYFGKDLLYRVKLPSSALVRVNRVNDHRGRETERVAQWEDKVVAFL